MYAGGAKEVREARNHTTRDTEREQPITLPAGSPKINGTSVGRRLNDGGFDDCSLGLDSAALTSGNSQRHCPSSGSDGGRPCSTPSAGSAWRWRPPAQVAHADVNTPTTTSREATARPHRTILDIVRWWCTACQTLGDLLVGHTRHNQELDDANLGHGFRNLFVLCRFLQRSRSGEEAAIPPPTGHTLKSASTRTGQQAAISG